MFTLSLEFYKTCQSNRNAMEITSTRNYVTSVEYRKIKNDKLIINYLDTNNKKEAIQ